MGACKKLLNGLDLTCTSFNGRYYQSIVLVNRVDINQYRIENDDLNHKLYFNLIAGLSGKLFRAFNAGSLLNATFSKNEVKGVPVYNHSVQIPVVGTSEAIKIILKQLDKSDLFAVIQCTNGDIEVLGFENGLKSDGYTYNIQSGIGGATITMSSRYEEYQPPYLYQSINGTPTDDFDNNFLNLPTIGAGDFNNDFSDDFFIEVLSV